MSDWHNRVYKWAEDRNLAEGSTPIKQCKKLLEELHELLEAIHDCDTDATKDAIGDVCVVLAVIGRQIEMPAKAWEFLGPDLYPLDIADEIAFVTRVASAIALGRSTNPKVPLSDELVDAFIAMASVARQRELAFEACLEAAWSEIKDRKGRMVDGVFMKE